VSLLLPVAAWAEKGGSYTSMERRVQWIDQVCLPLERPRKIVDYLLDRQEIGSGLQLRQSIRSPEGNESHDSDLQKID